MPRVAGVDARQPFNSGAEMFVGIRPVDHPPAFASRVTGSIAESPVKLRQIGVLDADEMEFGVLPEYVAGSAVVLWKSDPLRQYDDARQHDDRGRDRARTRNASAHVLILSAARERGTDSRSI